MYLLSIAVSCHEIANVSASSHDHLFTFLTEKAKALRGHTPGNVCAVQRRLLSTVEVVQYSGGLTSVQWRANISTVEAVQYSGGLTSVQWRLCSTVEG